MKIVLAALLCLTVVTSTKAFANPQAEEGQNSAQCQVAPEPSAVADVEAFIADKAATDANFGYWHCTAYAPGSHHTDGHEYRDVHYNHAYWGARQSCERFHHYCPDVHCHYDGH